MDVDDVEQVAATGALPRWDRVEHLVVEAHARYRDHAAGDVADYIPVLAAVDPALFGVSVAVVDGELHEAGDTGVEFSVQSISKAFVYALVCEAYGHETVRDRVGVNNTGLPFNSVMALELDGVVYRSESETNIRNRAIARLLESYGRIQTDPLEVVDVYTRQCALRVTARDLAVMGATLADGGVNPVTGERVVSAQVCRDTLAVLASTGLYERSGEWLFEIGLPAKSGVAGGIVAVAPGKGAIGTFSPPLDPAGNSVRGTLCAAYLSRTLGLDILASAPMGH